MNCPLWRVLYCIVLYWLSELPTVALCAGVLTYVFLLHLLMSLACGALFCTIFWLDATLLFKYCCSYCCDNKLVLYRIVLLLNESVRVRAQPSASARVYRHGAVGYVKELGCCCSRFVILNRAVDSPVSFDMIEGNCRPRVCAAVRYIRVF